MTAGARAEVIMGLYRGLGSESDSMRMLTWPKKGKTSEAPDKKKSLVYPFKTNLHC